MSQDKNKAGGDPVAALQAENERLKSELMQAEWKIAELEARADVDTQLDILNPRGFERELARSLAFARRYDIPAVLMSIDLDGLKPINDRHGHAAGDALLKAVAATLARHVRASDVVGRFGGDRFGVVLWKIAEPQAAIKARDLEERIAQTVVMHDGKKLSVGASAGFAPLSANATPAQVIEAADLALAARKKERSAG